MTTKTRRQYADEFKAEAVWLVRDSPRPVTQVARDLGIADHLLYRWRAEQEELTLRREHSILKQERDFFTTCGGVLREGVAMRYRAIQEHDRRDPIRLLCRALAVSPAGYYAWRGGPERHRRAGNRTLLVAIRVIHQESRHTYGSPRIWQPLVWQGQRVGEHRVARLMRHGGIRAKTITKWCATTQSQHSFPVAANTLDRAFTVEAPNRVWAGDLTYIWTMEGWLYLAVLLDLYSRAVIGWDMGSWLTGELTQQALEMALDRRQPKPGLLHHSDRGSQYAATAYQQQLRAAGMIGSMSRRGNCWDNACVESFFGTVKRELIPHRQCWTREEAKREIFEYL